MPLPTNVEPSKTRFGQKMVELMDEQGLSLNEMAGRLDSTYEYVRRLTRGLQLPSKHMVKLIAMTLKTDEHELQTLMSHDRIEHEHGTIPMELSGKNPELAFIERNWKLLTDEQKALINAQVKTFASQNRKHKIAR